MSESYELDVLVIGGGVTGAGIALEAASRGLTTGIVEAQDWASGTSSRSSKLVHGGLRYLQMLDFSLVREALKERELLLTRIAPHLVQKVPFLYPLKHRVFERGFVGIGIAFYDALASLGRGKRATPFHRHFSRTKLAQVFPGIRVDAAVGAIEYWDAKVDDARLVFTLVRTAVDHGALAANRTRMVSLTRNDEGSATGAVLRDLENGRTFQVRAKTVVAAAGVWTEDMEALAEAGPELRVLASKGVHVTVPRDRISGEKGVILKLEKSVLFIIPWQNFWLIGTTDTPYTGELQHPAATATDIQYILDQANSVLSSTLGRDDVVGVFAGLRPLLQPAKNTPSTKISREHTVASPIPGFVVIAGGKLTTYRPMAQDAVDFLLGEDGRRVRPSVTSSLPLAGAENFLQQRESLEQRLRSKGIGPSHAEHLLDRYGTMVDEILAVIAADSSLRQPLRSAPGYLRAEIVHAAEHEMVLHLDDVMSRRTRIDYETPDKGLAVIDEVLELIAPVLGWDDARCEAERERYMKLAELETACEQVVDDHEAAAVMERLPEHLRTLAETSENGGAR